MKNFFKNDFVYLITDKCSKYGLNANLVSAFIKVESGYNMYACRFEPEWKYFLTCEKFAKFNNQSFLTEKNQQATSWGLMQVMGTVARELGFEGCLDELVVPEVNLEYGCKKLNQLFNHYSHMDDVISAYNQGSPKKFQSGFYRNQEYVDKVKGVFNGL